MYIFQRENCFSLNHEECLACLCEREFICVWFCIVGSLLPFVILQCHSNVTPTCPDCYALYLCIHIKSTNVVKGREFITLYFFKYYQRITCYLSNIKSLQNLLYRFWLVICIKGSTYCSIIYCTKLTPRECPCMFTYHHQSNFQHIWNNWSSMWFCDLHIPWVQEPYLNFILFL